MRRRSMRSATSPPGSVKSAIGTNTASPAYASTIASPVRSYRYQPIATDWICSARPAKKRPARKRTKSRIIASGSSPPRPPSPSAAPRRRRTCEAPPARSSALRRRDRRSASARPARQPPSPLPGGCARSLRVASSRAPRARSTKRRHSPARRFRSPSARGEALRAGDGKRAQVARFEVRGHRREDLEDHRGVAAFRRRDYLACRLVRDDLQVDAGARLEELGGEVLRAADADGAGVQLARSLLRLRDQVRSEE